MESERYNEKKHNHKQKAQQGSQEAQPCGGGKALKLGSLRTVKEIIIKFLICLWRGRRGLPRPTCPTLRGISPTGTVWSWLRRQGQVEDECITMDNGEERWVQGWV